MNESVVELQFKPVLLHMRYIVIAHPTLESHHESLLDH